MSKPSRVALGIDVGVRRIGLAIGDTAVKIASPIAPVFNKGDALDQIVRVTSNRNVDVIVIGLPRNSNGLETKQSEYSRSFSRDLTLSLTNAGLNPEVVFQDESLTSVKAEDILKQGRHYDDKMLRDGTLDSEAAAIILTDYLESLK